MYLCDLLYSTTDTAGLTHNFYISYVFIFDQCIKKQIIYFTS